LPVLLLTSQRFYPEVNLEPEQELIRRLEEAIFTDATEVDAGTVMAVSLAISADLLRVPFDKKSLKQRKVKSVPLVFLSLVSSAFDQPARSERMPGMRGWDDSIERGTFSPGDRSSQPERTSSAEVGPVLAETSGVQAALSETLRLCATALKKGTRLPGMYPCTG
jgi:hypothetical protein